MKKLSKLLMTVACLGMSANAMAGPLLPTLGPGSPPVAGESILDSLTSPGDLLRVDWIVEPVTSFNILAYEILIGSSVDVGDFAYLYQIENYGAGVPDFFSVGIDSADIGSVKGSGFSTTSIDLAHHSGVFANLGAPDLLEMEPGGVIGGMGLFTTVGSDSVSWFFTEVNPTDQSITMLFVSSLPPVYGVAGAQNGSSPSPWNSLNPLNPGHLGELVPVPGGVEVPEPSTYALLGLSLGVAAFARRRRVEA